jgi:hypothetical protein
MKKIAIAKDRTQPLVKFEYSLKISQLDESNREIGLYPFQIA